MKKLSFIFLMSCLFIPLSIAQTEIQIAQWALRAQASSEYTSDQWSAARATGEPDVLACEDNANAWASATVSDDESLTLTYVTAVIPTQVNIYQNYNPGGITGIAIIPTGGGNPIPIRSSADPGGDCPTVFSITLPGGLPETNKVVIYLDQSALANWNEIDAVELVGTTTGDASASSPSSIENEDFPQYNLVTNGARATNNNNVVPPSQSGNNNPQPTEEPVGIDNEGSAQSQVDFGGEWGDPFTCGNTTVDNAATVTIIQQRPGSSYRITAIGINGFDPVLGLSDDFGTFLCNDDDAEAANYSANLPTASASAARTSSQIRYNVTGNSFANIKLWAGGFNGAGGEFIMIVEGMLATSADGAGDPFSMYISPAMIMSDVSPSVYMISVVSAFDPYLYLIDGDYNPIYDSNGNIYGCDDAGSACWGQSRNLTGFYVSRSQNRQLAGGRLDAMLTIPIDVDSWGGYHNYMMTGNNTYGDYVAAFHIGVAAQNE